MLKKGRPDPKAWPGVACEGHGLYNQLKDTPKTYLRQ